MDQSVKTLASVSEADVARLATLTSDFAQDPKLTSRRLRTQKTRIETIRNKLKTIAEAISKKSADELKRLADDLNTKSTAARLAAEDLSKDEPLGGVGSEAWRKLWDAARAYSIADPYPGEPFPNTADASRCVLCQQQLGKDAKERLRRFESFVRDRTQKEEEDAKLSLTRFAGSLARTSISVSDLLNDIQFVHDEISSALAVSIRGFALRAQWRLRAILKANADTPNALPAFDEEALVSAINALETRAHALLAANESEERKKLRAELDELKDRQWLSGIKSDVLAEIERLKAIAKLDAALRDTRQSAITSKNTALSEALITERLRARFAQEINHLNLAGLAIELSQASSQSGIARFRISLIESSSRNAGDILSEGEYRCVALAGFLAELATNDSGSGIIFDDPVSSLDHLHRESIAKRLAHEGRTRQVIVFTHDLPFLFLLRNACTQVDDPADKTEVALRHIQKRLKTPGHCRNEAPDKAQDAFSRLMALSTHLANTRWQYDQDPDGTDWLITARGLIDSLRQTWEVAVEDAISPVLRTFSHKVNTKGFAKLSAIKLEDAESMRKHYGQLPDQNIRKQLRGHARTR